MNFNPHTKRYIEMIVEDYNPDHDMPQGIQVSWVEYTLLQAIQQLQEKVTELEAKINEHERSLDILAEYRELN